eukprot:3887082-Pleurochrysis_carterae.AAC.3
MQGSCKLACKTCCIKKFIAEVTCSLRYEQAGSHGIHVGGKRWESAEEEERGEKFGSLEQFDLGRLKWRFGHESHKWM